MGISACCLLDIGVSKETLHDPDAHLIFGPSGGECVPLRYNKDKSGNPLFARVSGFVLILFPLKTPLFSGVQEGGRRQSFHIKDKNVQSKRAIPTAD